MEFQIIILLAFLITEIVVSKQKEKYIKELRRNIDLQKEQLSILTESYNNLCNQLNFDNNTVRNEVDEH